jgi:DNA-binding transcriptional LysR family regulator
MLNRQRAPIYHDLVLALAREAGVVLTVHTEARSFTESLSLVAAGLGVSLLPSSCRDLPWKGVSFCRLKSLASELETGIVLRKERTSELIENFLEVARSAN